MDAAAFIDVVRAEADVPFLQCLHPLEVFLLYAIEALFPNILEWQLSSSIVSVYISSSGPMHYWIISWIYFKRVNQPPEPKIRLSTDFSYYRNLFTTLHFDKFYPTTTTNSVLFLIDSLISRNRLENVTSWRLTGGLGEGGVRSAPAGIHLGSPTPQPLG